jgi:hypothetical protein
MIASRCGSNCGLACSVLVNGAAGVVVTVRGEPFAVMGFTVADHKVVEIDVIADPDRVRRIAAAVLERSTPDKGT